MEGDVDETVQLAAVWTQEELGRENRQLKVGSKCVRVRVFVCLMAMHLLTCFKCARRGVFFSLRAVSDLRLRGY